jgi:hypothetical protein
MSGYLRSILLVIENAILIVIFGIQQFCSDVQSDDNQVEAKNGQTANNWLNAPIEQPVNDSV